MKNTVLFFTLNLKTLPSMLADLKLPGVIGDLMVVQQEQSDPIWGWDTPGTKITVSFAGQNYCASANESGSWTAKLAALSANTWLQELSVIGSTTREIQYVLIGEVWLCQGRSNMQMGIDASARSERVMCRRGTSEPPCALGKSFLIGV
jgi:sialate O-acetylesterase